MPWVALIGAAVGIGTSAYAGDQQRKLTNQAVKAQQQANYAGNKLMLTLVEIGGLSLLVFSIAYIVGKRA